MDIGKDGSQAQGERGEEDTGGHLQCLQALRGSNYLLIPETDVLPPASYFLSTQTWSSFVTKKVEEVVTCLITSSVRICLSPVWDNG